MKETDFVLMSEKQFDEVIRYISELTSQRFMHLNLSDDIASNILAKLIKSPAPTDPMGIPADFINSVFPKAVEDVFNNYHKLSFLFCLLKTQDPSLSEDTSQEVIRLLLSSKNKINNVYGWIRQVTHNLLCEHYRRLKHERKLYSDLMNEASLIEQITNNTEELNFSKPEQMIPRSVLNGGNYISYLRLKQFDNLADYAKASNISYEAAKGESKRINRNLKSEILLALGWQASPDILDYRQYRSIQSFIRYLLVSVSAKETGLGELRRLHPDLPKVLDGYKSVEDWGISMVGERRFRLYLLHTGTDPIPLISTIIVTLNHRNHVKVESCKRNQHAGSHDIPANLLIPKDKGRSLWSYDRIISLLSENNR
ncbi:MAG: hypothetical protein WCY21_05260 [Candidatus Cloacimonadaceae bacterium]|jgi:hypothetical protein|nr:hypothetical protein [Candidatus Cloacimonadota bacterium]MDX9949864.1 hypothetical protein [Candidatus Syntrophosphaera sp.]